MRRFLIALPLAALAACAVPGVAGAASPPQITAAAIDARDRLVATWQLAPGTRFDTIEFSASSVPDPILPESFAGFDNTAASECSGRSRYCDAPPTLTSYRSTERVSRDRRYFVKVTARDAERKQRISQVWVIDETKPLMPSGEGRPPATPTNTPVLGRPFTPPAPETIPSPTVSLLAPPRTIGGVLRRGVRVRVTCPAAECWAFVGLELNVKDLALADYSIRPGGRHTFVLRPEVRRRGPLRRRSRARLLIRTDITQPGGKQTMIVRRVNVRR